MWSSSSTFSIFSSIQNIDGIFNYYSEGSDKISYHHFIEEFVGREGELISNQSRLSTSQKSNYDPSENKSMTLSQVTQGKQENSPNKSKKMVVINNYTDLLGYIKATLQEQGLGSLAELAAKLKISDKGKTHKISTMKLFSALPFLTMDHLNILADELSEGKDNIDYSLLVYDLKGQINQNISAEISNTFHFLDTKREGQIFIDYLLSRFLSRSLEAKFRKAVESYSTFQGITDGVFTEDDFNDFLGFLSFDYSLSEKFKSEVIRAFYDEDNKSTTSQKSNRTRDFQGSKNQKGEGSQPGGDFRKEKGEKKLQSEELQEDDHFNKFKQDLDDKDEKKSVSRYSKYQGHELNNSRMSVFESVIQRIKKRLASKGTKGFLILQKSLKNADLNQDTLLTVDEFIQVIKDQRIDITLTECNSIFDLFDNQGTGLISFPEFMFTIRGQMPSLRRELVNKLWLQVKINVQQTSLSKIRHSLNFRIHPDVQAGRRYQDDIWKQIQDTIFLIQQLNGRARGDTVLRGDFDEYMQNLSLSVIDDKLFESILLNFWRLDNSLSIIEKYAGSRKLFDQSKNGYLMDHHRNYVKGGSVSENAPFGTFKEATTYTTEHKRL